jgi:alkyl hydroperoxide reductase subunit AhpC
VNDLPVGRDVDETLRLLQAFQFVEEHGEVCPANWKPGKATIKPGVTASKAFFGAGHTEEASTGDAKKARTE